VLEALSLDGLLFALDEVLFEGSPPHPLSATASEVIVHANSTTDLLI
jgi:hypothetical protein